MPIAHLVPSTVRHPVMLAGAAAMLALTAAGCGSSNPSPAPAATSRAAAPASAPEVNPAGDIPDNQAFVAFSVPGSNATVKIPEGWSRTSPNGAVRFADKLNAITVATTKVAAAPTAREVKQTEIPKLAASVPGFKLQSVSTVTRPAGTAIRTVYLADAKADPVTGKSGVDAVERYDFVHRGQDLVLTLSGPKGADNVDPWKIVTGSVRFGA